MTARLSGICARHLQLQRDLLGLWQHTLDFPRDTPTAGWEVWSRKRQRLLDRVLGHDWERLAAETEQALSGTTNRVLASTLVSLCARERQLVQSIGALEASLCSTLRRDLEVMGRRLAVRHRAGTVRSAYRPAASSHGQLSRLG